MSRTALSQLEQMPSVESYYPVVSPAFFLKILARKARRGQSLEKPGKEANLRLAISIAKKYNNRGQQFLDLIDQGNIT